jgi:hypothetical protein
VCIRGNDAGKELKWKEEGITDDPGASKESDSDIEFSVACVESLHTDDDDGAAVVSAGA